MIALCLTPQGITAVTPAMRYYETSSRNDSDFSDRLTAMPGMSNTRVLWGKIVVIYTPMLKVQYDSEPERILSRLESMWDTAPHISVFMSHFKKAVKDDACNVIAMVAGYDMPVNSDDNATPESYVYMVLGLEMFRFCIYDDGTPEYRLVLAGDDDYAERIFGQIRLLNGDVWEDKPMAPLRCDLFSLAKGMDVCRFAVLSSMYMIDFNGSMLDDRYDMECVTLTRSSVDVRRVRLSMALSEMDSNTKL